ncbi:MAG TPA: DUF58 domain-containing protein [Acidimicrobiales bacterium]|nr:DUF58 domain-containing protein [Acidimicrobiales bacterium]
MQPPPTGGWTRQTRATMGTGGALLAAGAAWTTWLASGSRLALFVCFAGLLAIALDLVLAVLATRRVRATVDSTPTDAYVGDTVPFTLSVTGPRLSFQVRVLEKGQLLVATPPASGRLMAVADRREVVTEVEVEVAGSGLCGLVTCARRQRVPLRRPLAVGPRPLAPPHPFPELFGAWGEGAPRPAPVGDVVRGVRDYVPGDPVRRVHWPSSARRGDLVVKEVEEPGAPRLVVVLDLGGGAAAGEEAAARAAWYAYEALRRGYEVVLATAEPGGAVTGRLGPPTDVNQRLARAVRGKPRPPTVGATRQAVVTVTPDGDSWPS